MKLEAHEFAVLEKALKVPALWAFSVVVARLGGVAQALEHARARTIPDELRDEFQRCGWTAESVPPVAILEQLVLGARLYSRVRGGAKVRQAADAVGVTFGVAVDALDALDIWAGSVLRRKESGA